MLNSPILPRRHAIAAIGGILASVGTNSLSPAVASVTDEHDSLPWIDAHSHIWTSDIRQFKLRQGVTVAELQPASFTDTELMAIAMPEGIGRAVLIQHYPYHGFDNSYLLDAVQRHPERFRVVGMIDDQLPHADRRMRELLKLGVTGFRIGPRGEDSAWLKSDGMALMWKTAAETRQAMCCLINPADLQSVSEMCGRHPDTPVVIDHFARIGISGVVDELQLAELCRLSQHPHVRVKISAYYALGAKRPPHYELVPMIQRLFEAYGPDRLMWASDCPYQLGDGNSYASSISLVRDHIKFVTTEERSKLLRTTAESTFFFA